MKFCIVPSSEEYKMVLLFSSPILQLHKYSCAFSSDVASNYWLLTANAYFDLLLEWSHNSFFHLIRQCRIGK